MAERVGFEPVNPLQVKRFRTVSKRSILLSRSKSEHQVQNRYSTNSVLRLAVDDFRNCVVSAA
jgi:hypothetical protein